MRCRCSPHRLKNISAPLHAGALLRDGESERYPATRPGLSSVIATTWHPWHHPGHCLETPPIPNPLHYSSWDIPTYLLSVETITYSIMSLVPQSGPSSSMSREGSRTALIVQNTTEQRDAAPSELTAGRPPPGTLRLRGGPRASPHVAWDEDVVDNEGLGRKKSKSTMDSD